MGLPVMVAMAGVSAMNSVFSVFVEAITEVGTDIVMDSVNDFIEASFPSAVDNKYFKQFNNQMKMGISCATNAYITKKAMVAQQTVEKKTKEKLDGLKNKLDLHLSEVNGASWYKSKKSKNLSVQRTKEEYHEGINTLMSNADRQVLMRNTGALEGTGFATGTGGAGYKGGNDGTIQNLKPDSNIALCKAINSLLNGMDKYPDKSGTTTI